MDANICLKVSAYINMNIFLLADFWISEFMTHADCPSRMKHSVRKKIIINLPLCTVAWLSKSIQCNVTYSSLQNNKESNSAAVCFQNDICNQFTVKSNLKNKLSLTQRMLLRRWRQQCMAGRQDNTDSIWNESFLLDITKTNLLMRVDMQGPGCPQRQGPPCRLSATEGPPSLKHFMPVWKKQLFTVTV